MGLQYIRAARLIDGTGAASIADGAVLVDGQRIAEVGSAAAVPCPEGAERLDFGDLTLMPGLVDCHVHINNRGDGNPIEGSAPEDDDLRVLQSAANARIARSGHYHPPRVRRRPPYHLLGKRSIAARDHHWAAHVGSWPAGDDHRWPRLVLGWRS